MSPSPSSSSSLSSVSSYRALVLSAATDGRIALWDVTSLIHDNVFTRRTKLEFSDVCGEEWEGEGDEQHKGQSSVDKSDAPTVCANMDSSQRNCHKDENLGDLGTPSWWHQCHQSGVNSLDTRQLSGKYHITSYFAYFSILFL